MKFKILDFLSRKLDTADYEAIGIDFSTQVYFKELALYIAISYIANTISKCEIKTFEKGEEVQNELYYMLNYNPNPNQNSSQFMNDLIERYFYEGETLVVPYKNYVYCADGFAIDEKPLKQNEFSSISIENQLLSKKYKASDVFYFKLDNRKVIALVNGLYQEYGAIIASAISAFKKNNAEKYKLILGDFQAGDPRFAKTYNNVIKKQLEGFLNSDKAVYPQFRGYDLQRMDSTGQTSSDPIINIRKEVFETTAQAFKIPLSMMYGNITNMNEIVKVYLSICIDPIAQMISEELTRKTNTYDTWKAGNRVVVDTSCINHVDILEIGDAVDKLVASGFASIDDLRKRTGMQLLNTDFSKAHFITKNYAPADSSLNNLEGGEGIAE